MYHQRGDYAVGYKGRWLAPVNRTYQRRSGTWTRVYGKHHQPSEVDVSAGEAVLDFFGFPFLFVDEAHAPPIALADDPLVDGLTAFGEASNVLGVLREVVASVPGSRGGVHGSHQVGLATSSSDIDLVGWCRTGERSRLRSALDDGLRMHGFLSLTGTELGRSHAQRYTERLALGPAVGAYLSSHRSRWWHPDSTTRVSFQCVQDDYDHASAAQILADGLRVGSDAGYPVQEVVWAEDVGFDSNHPRLWAARDASGESVRLISMSWVHQSMGPRHANEVGVDFVVRGTAFRTTSGVRYVVLARDGDHYLPARLVHA
jgi:hypothetical protein